MDYGTFVVPFTTPNGYTPASIVNWTTTNGNVVVTQSYISGNNIACKRFGCTTGVDVIAFRLAFVKS